MFILGISFKRYAPCKYQIKGGLAGAVQAKSIQEPSSMSNPSIKLVTKCG